MSIASFIREFIKGSDSTLNLYDISNHAYGTLNPAKSQRATINRAISTVVDDVNIAAIQSFDSATKIVFNPLSDKSTLIACEKRKRGDEIQYTDTEIWKALGKQKDGHSFGEIDTRTKLLAAKARDPENALQIEMNFEAEREAYFKARERARRKKAIPANDDAAQALITLYDYTRSVKGADNSDRDVEIEHDGNMLKFTYTPIK